MKKPKLIALIVTIAVIVLAAVGVILFFVFSGDDAAKKANGDITEDSTESGDSSVAPETPIDEPAVFELCDTFLDAYISGDGETVGACLTGLGEPMQFNELTKALSRRVSVSVGNATTDGTYVTVNADITNVDLASVLADLPELNSQEEAREYLIDTLQDDSIATKTFPVQIILVKVGDKYKVQMSHSLSNALLGGYYDVVESLTETETTTDTTTDSAMTHNGGTMTW